MEKKYWAFISYSHADEDVARWLHRALETYAIPGRLRAELGPGAPRRLFPVFRDREELASSDSLSDNINTALAQSDALIVIASPRSAQSHWVNEEILRYKAMGRGQVYCVIADGEPFAQDAEQECFAPALRFLVTPSGELTDTPTEPLAADIRTGKDGKRDGLLKLIAGILGIGLDALKQRDQQRRQRQLFAVAALSIAASVITSTLAAVAFQARDEAQAQRELAIANEQEAHAQRNLAEQRQHQAEGLIQFMLGDLRKKLEPIGKLDILDAVGEQALSYFAAVHPQDLSDEELSAQAKALRQIGDVRLQQGDIETATTAFRQALTLDEERVRRHPEDAEMLFELAQSEYYMGARYYNAGDFEQAQPWWERYKSNADRLVALDEANVKWLQEVSYAYNNLLLLALRRGQWERCEQLGEESERFNQNFPRGSSANKEFLVSHSESLNSWSYCLESLGRIDKAVSVSQRHLHLRHKLAEQNPQDTNGQWLLGVALDATARLERSGGNLKVAHKLAQEALAILSSLTTHDPSNAQWAYFLMLASHHLSEIEIVRGNFDGARRHLVAAMQLNLQLIALDDRYLQSSRYLLSEHALHLALVLADSTESKDLEAAVRKLGALLEQQKLSEKVSNDLAIACAVHAAVSSATELCSIVNKTSLVNADVVTLNLVAELRQAAGISDSTPPTLNTEQTRMLENTPHWALLRIRQSAVR